MNYFWNKIANVSRGDRPGFSNTAAGRKRVTQIIAGVGCYFMVVQYWRCSLATSIVLVAIGASIQIIAVNWAKNIFQRRLWRVLSSAEDCSMAESPHGTTVTSEQEDSASMPSPVLPTERSHSEASCTRTNMASSNSRTPTCGEDPFEGAITRLAGAVELGTEPLIYVRRKDVAEVVDAVVENAKTPGGLGVASPTLARLTIVRRSKGQNRKGRRSVDSPEFRTTRGVKCMPSTDGSVSSSTLLDSGGDHLSSSSSSLRRGRPLKGRTLFREINAASEKKTKSSSGLMHRPSSPASAVKLLHLLTTPRMSKGDDQGGEHSIWQQILRSSYAAKPTPSKVPAAWATIQPSSSTSGASEVKMAASPPMDNKKITRVSVSTHATGKEAAFEDFWSTGWG